MFLTISRLLRILFATAAHWKTCCLWTDSWALWAFKNVWPLPIETLLPTSDPSLMFCIQVSKLYPPRSAQDLKNLHGLILSSESPDHHKQSVLYYILKDVSHSNGQEAQKFARVSYLPENYKIFIDGIWYLDRLKFEVYSGSRHFIVGSY